jgi:hypothetical protein
MPSKRGRRDHVLVASGAVRVGIRQGAQLVAGAVGLTVDVDERARDDDRQLFAAVRMPRERTSGADAHEATVGRRTCSTAVEVDQADARYGQLPRRGAFGEPEQLARALDADVEDRRDPRAEALEATAADRREQLLLDLGRRHERGTGRGKLVRGIAVARELGGELGRPRSTDFASSREQVDASVGAAR